MLALFWAAGRSSWHHVRVLRCSNVSSLARRSSRHAVELACEVVTSDHDEPQLFWATDLSPEGIWLETSQPIIDTGSELVVCFRPAVWWEAREIIVFGEVARVSHGLRHEDEAPGIGVAFLDLSPSERWSLRCWLRPRPERSPARRGRKPVQVCATVDLPPHRYSDHPFAARVS